MRPQKPDHILLVFSNNSILTPKPDPFGFGALRGPCKDSMNLWTLVRAVFTGDDASPGIRAALSSICRALRVQRGQIEDIQGFCIRNCNFGFGQLDSSTLGTWALK